MHQEKKDKGVFHPEYYKKLYEQANERKETLQRMYDAAAHRGAILKEKNTQLVDALNVIKKRGNEKFEAYADGMEIDFRKICGAMIEIASIALTE